MIAKWSEKARQQFASQRRYYRKNAPNKLDDLIHEIIQAEQRACSNPYGHRMIPEYQNNLRREILVWSFRLQYRVFEAQGYIEITALYHQRQHLPDI